MSTSPPQASVTSVDYVVVGAGIVGLTLSLELRRRHPKASIVLIEKEALVGQHSSGRNSGILHSGIYYAQGTFKAKLCAQGARELASYCEERNLPLERRGKIILPVRSTDSPQLQTLLERAKDNGARAELIDTEQLKRLEPEAHSCTGQALHLPDTAVIDPMSVLMELTQDLSAQNIELALNEEVLAIDDNKRELRTNKRQVNYGRLYNCAGLHAHRIAQLCGLAQNLMLLPTKGLYYKLSHKSVLSVRHQIYPVPDLRMPFLGVHFTVTATGETYLGPTAIPAFGPENYGLFRGLSLLDAPGILRQLLKLYLANKQGFRLYVHSEATRFFKHKFAEAARALVPALRPKDLLKCDKVGIRPQLVDLQKQELITDFMISRTTNSTHILNAISPAFTCSLPFARFVLDEEK